MNGTQKAFGDALKLHRAKRKMTRAQLCSLAGVTISNLQIYEAGIGNPCLNTICRLTDALGFSLTIHPKKPH